MEVFIKDNSQLNFFKIHFSFPKLSYYKFLESQFGCPVLYDQPVDELVFPKPHLSHEFSMANEVSNFHSAFKFWCQLTSNEYRDASQTE